jgi:hypothetical protein
MCNKIITLLLFFWVPLAIAYSQSFTTIAQTGIDKRLGKMSIATTKLSQGYICADKKEKISYIKGKYHYFHSKQLLITKHFI